MARLAVCPSVLRSALRGPASGGRAAPPACLPLRSQTLRAASEKAAPKQKRDSGRWRPEEGGDRQRGGEGWGEGGGRGKQAGESGKLRCTSVRPGGAGTASSALPRARGAAAEPPPTPPRGFPSGQCPRSVPEARGRKRPGNEGAREPPGLVSGTATSPALPPSVCPRRETPHAPVVGAPGGGACQPLLPRFLDSVILLPFPHLLQINWYKVVLLKMDTFGCFEGHGSQTSGPKTQFHWLNLPLPPSSSSCSWATGFSNIRKIQEGQGEKQQPPESSPRVDVSGFTTSQAGKTRTEAYTTGRQLFDPGCAARAPAGSGALSPPQKWPVPTPEEGGGATRRSGDFWPDYTRYNQLSRAVRELARRLRDLPERDQFRVRASAALLDKLYALGLVPTRGSLELCDFVTASSFCRRRLPTVLLKLRMAQHLQAAVAFVEQGHVRVGPDVVTDPAFLVTRSMEDFVTWVDSSKIKRHVLEYNEERDDFDLEA
ncbi:PREDICTED: U3 small nucleolar ribonucleoprotein protein IMP3 [Mandrillus leucophaeus]|nr:PREDICTED: U3 small nucleolar ribonucleoprotein protein IMP3 [Mandrillus leucophaeus]